MIFLMIMLITLRNSSILDGVRNINIKEKLLAYLSHNSLGNFIKSEFSRCFKKSNLVVICPLYAAGEKRILNLI